MAHRIEPRADGSYAMAYANGAPWHRLGTSVQDLMTWKQAVELVPEINAEIATGEAWGGVDATHLARSENYRAVYRETDGKVFGFAKRDWQPVQGRDRFEFMDSLVKDGVMRYETIISMRGGSRVVLLARMQEEWKVGKNDVHRTYIVLIGHNEPGLAEWCFPTDIRVVCDNTAELALGSKDGRRGVKITHRGDIQGKLAEAARVLQVTTAEQRRYQEWVKTLAATKAERGAALEVADSMFGTLDEDAPGRRRKAVERFLEYYAQEQRAVGENGYAILNAVTAYGNYGRNTRGGDEGRFESIVGGGGADWMRKGATAIEDILGVARPGTPEAEVATAAA